MDYALLPWSESTTFLSVLQNCKARSLFFYKYTASFGIEGVKEVEQEKSIKTNRRQTSTKSKIYNRCKKKSIN